MDFNKYFSNLEITESDIERVIKSLRNKDISFPQGATKELEEKIADFFGIKYALAHCNGTGAMLSAMYGVGINKGDEVICPTYTWWASVSPALTLGATPVFCEIKDDNLTLDPADVKRKITKKTKAIVVPHLWGNYGDVLEIKKIIKENFQKIYIIEDVSHSVGATIGGRKLGVLGDVGIFSLQKSKVLSAGEGGMLITNDKEIYESSIFLGHYERIKDLTKEKILKYKKTGGGYKFRINPLGAALALGQLETLEKRIEKQNQLTSYFESKIKQIEAIDLFNKNQRDFKRGGIISLKGEISPKILKDRIAIKKLEECFIKQDYFPLLHLEPLFLESKSKFTGVGQLPTSEKICKNIFSIPVFFRGDKEAVDTYVGIIKKTLSDLYH